MVVLTELYASGSNISDLTGLEYAINLRSLNLNRSTRFRIMAPLVEINQPQITARSLAQLDLRHLIVGSGLTKLTDVWIFQGQLNIGHFIVVDGLTKLRIAGSLNSPIQYQTSHRWVS